MTNKALNVRLIGCYREFACAWVRAHAIARPNEALPFLKTFQEGMKRKKLKYLGLKYSEGFNPLSANPTKLSKLFECVWPFCGVGA